MSADPSARFNEWLAESPGDLQIRELPPREPIWADPGEFSPALVSRLQAFGIERLYSHQSEAARAAIAGEDVLVVTGTDSGKTLCYNIPSLHLALTEPAARVLYLYPTKALAQDQLRKLLALIEGLPVRAGTYDGDTPKSHRGMLRREAHLILTNPDMLHRGILPGHENWVKFLRSLRLIVLDEVHAYRGVFGSHVGGVLRRLLRLCAWHSAFPKIVACSATIANPEAHFERLVGRTAKLIDRDGSPRGKRTFVFMNPPKIGENERLSATVASSEIFASLVESQVRTMAFCRSRLATELVLRTTRDRLAKGEVVAPSAIESYRGGYTPVQRRKIESDLFSGKLLGLATTSAMELGVDVGSLDAVVISGYPGTVASLWQQAGRGGRGARDGLSILVARDEPLDQFLVQNPERLLDSKAEPVLIRPDNEQILTQQLRCAAFERALSPSELDAFGAKALEVAESLDRSGEFAFRAGRFFYAAHESPAQKVDIRSATGGQVTLFVGEEVLGTMERERALTDAHEGAIYLHQGAAFKVKTLDLTRMAARLEPYDGNTYTRAQVQSTVEHLFTLSERKLGSHEVQLASVRVTKAVLGYQILAMDGGSILGTMPLDLPPITFETLALRLNFPFPEDEETQQDEFWGVHAIEHALISVAPFFAGCDPGDLGSAWYTLFPDNLAPAIFLYDQVPGGIGLAEALVERFDDLCSAALTLLAECPCSEGCPSCLLISRCEAANHHLHKPTAIQHLSALAGR